MDDCCKSFLNHLDECDDEKVKKLLLPQVKMSALAKRVMGSKRLTPTTVEKMASKCFLLFECHPLMSNFLSSPLEFCEIGNKTNS